MKQIAFLNLYVPSQQIEQRTARLRTAILRVGCLLAAWLVVYAIADLVMRLRGF